MKILIASFLVMTLTTACGSDATSRVASNLKSDANRKHLEFFAEKGIRRFDQKDAEVSYGNNVTFKLIAWETRNVLGDRVHHYAAFSYEADSPTHGRLYGSKYVEALQMYTIGTDGTVQLDAPTENVSAGTTSWIPRDKLKESRYANWLAETYAEEKQKVLVAAGQKLVQN